MPAGMSFRDACLHAAMHNYSPAFMASLGKEADELIAKLTTEINELQARVSYEDAKKRYVCVCAPWDFTCFGCRITKGSGDG